MIIRVYVSSEYSEEWLYVVLMPTVVVGKAPTHFHWGYGSMSGANRLSMSGVASDEADIWHLLWLVLPKCGWYISHVSAAYFFYTAAAWPSQVAKTWLTSFGSFLGAERFQS